jgi:hypothetical protein
LTTQIGISDTDAAKFAEEILKSPKVCAEVGENTLVSMLLLPIDIHTLGGSNSSIPHQDNY